MIIMMGSDSGAKASLIKKLHVSPTNLQRVRQRYYYYQL